MSYATKGGAWISATKVTRIDCSQCGAVTTTRHPLNDREEEALISSHAREKHGGLSRG